LLGIISVTGRKTELKKAGAAEFGAVVLRLKKIKHSKRWLKRLAACGVTRAAVSSELYNEVEKLLLGFGIVPVDGKMLLRRIAPQMALRSMTERGIPFSDAGAEIYSRGKNGFAAVAAFSGKMRYVSALGRGSKELKNLAREELGVSLIPGCIPRAMCKNILRIYLDGRPELFSLVTDNGEEFFKEAEITLPERYRGLCDADCVQSLAEALVQCGKLRISELEIKNVQLG